ncbi:MAG: hypothetical protein R2724_07390 [Bryobacterales bacterium]
MAGARDAHSLFFRFDFDELGVATVLELGPKLAQVGELDAFFLELAGDFSGDVFGQGVERNLGERERNVDVDLFGLVAGVDDLDVNQGDSCACKAAALLLSVNASTAAANAALLRLSMSDFSLKATRRCVWLRRLIRGFRGEVPSN